MPRAFLIKAKKEKKKEDEQASQAEHQHGQFSNEVAGECKRLDVAKIYRANFFEIFSFNSKSRCSGSFESRGCVITLGLFARRIFSNFCKLEQVCAGIELFCLNLALKLTYQNSNLERKIFQRNTSRSVPHSTATICCESLLASNSITALSVYCSDFE